MTELRVIPDSLRERFVVLDTGEVLTASGDLLSPDKSGSICFDGERYPAHRLAKHLAGYDVSNHHVHHLNFRHDDNRLRNLLCVTPKQHASIHYLFQWLCVSFQVHAQFTTIGGGRTPLRYRKGLGPLWREFLWRDPAPTYDEIVKEAERAGREAPALIFAILETAYEFEQLELLSSDFVRASLLPFPSRLHRDWLDAIAEDHGPYVRQILDRGEMRYGDRVDTGYRYSRGSFTKYMG